MNQRPATTTSAATATDFSTRFAPQVEALDRRWRDEPDTDRIFNRLIRRLAQEVLDAADPDRPGHEALRSAVAAFDDDLTDDDAAEEVLFALADITSPDSMRVVEDSAGRHLRAFDGDVAAEDYDTLHGTAEAYASELTSSPD